MRALLWYLAILLACLFFIGEGLRLVSAITGQPVRVGPVTITGSEVRLP